MPLIRGFHSTNVWKAFTLNSIVATLVIFLAMMVKGKFDSYQDEKGRIITRTTNAKSVLLTLLVTFGTSMLAYILMYFLFGFGKGMLDTIDM